ncbi:MAG TPA: class I SAM-dependent methyltransferase [Solirubrobacteraceae bacterium]
MAARRPAAVQRAWRRLADTPAAERVARRVLPDAVLRRVARRMGVRLPEPIDTEPLALLREAPAESLADAAYLERELLPHLGLIDDPGVFPAALQPHLGRGLRHYQYPVQFAPYLALLARHPIRSYLEVGVLHGGTFLITAEYLRRVHGLERATAVDIEPVPTLQAYAAEHPWAAFELVDSRTPRFRALLAEAGTYDLVLIDGNHSYEGCRSDVDAVAPHANVMVLHDIVDDASPGVRQVWAELREREAETYEFVELTAQYPEVRDRIGASVLGIGVAIRRDFA